jgi:ATP-dependent RNA helicase RhlB
MVANDEKVPLLVGLMRGFEDARVIVFINTKREADKVWGFLEGNGFPSAILSGDVPQKKRLSLLKRFSSVDVSVLVATDVAARGLHIDGVTHVINYDLPEDAEDYVHRIGRTARAGAEGDAISFVCETYAFSLPDIERYIEHKVPVGSISSEMLAEIDPRSRVRIEKGDRLQRRDGGGRKPHGGNGGGGGGGGGRRPRSEGSDAKPADGAETANKPRRRRRRRKPGGDSAAPA